jgi:hypothetical protein
MSGQENLATDVTVVESIIDTPRPGKDTVSNFLNRLMTDGTKVVVGTDFWNSTGHTLFVVTGQNVSSGWVLQLFDESFWKLGFHNTQSVVFTSVSDNGSNMVTGLSVKCWWKVNFVSKILCL